jgi:hypothetical protein
LLKLIRYAYPHTKSDIRPLVEVRHAWYAEHEDALGSFSEFEFLEGLTPMAHRIFRFPVGGQGYS